MFVISRDASMVPGLGWGERDAAVPKPSERRSTSVSN